jgi:hypothetical protein
VRAFWAILGVLMLAAAVYLLTGRGNGGNAAAPSRAQVATAPQPSPAAPGRASPGQSAAAPAVSALQPTPPSAPADPVRGGEETIGRTTFPPQPAGTGDSGSAPNVAGPVPTEELPAQAAAEPETQVAEAPSAEPGPGAGPVEPAAPVEAAPTPVAAVPDTPVSNTPEPVAAPEAIAQVPATEPAAAAGEWLVIRPDGSMIADGRYTVRGKGTAEEPYTISWEHLISAEEEYVPREGRSEIPKRIMMLHDKHVEITGYVAFPLLMDEADELLVMLNQWDGCCLGVPPTPYDAVEVRLKRFVTGNARMTSYGTLKGIMKVEPHLVGEWLVGLYMMEEAILNPLAFGGFAP